MTEKLTYSFDEAPIGNVELLGGKGANLVTMTKLGLSVPPGFIITTQACRKFFDQGGAFLDELWDQVFQALERLEITTERQFGSANAPLIVSVRSGAVLSMPGILETILNVGMNDVVLEGLKRDHGAQFALNSYLRLIRMFGVAVLGIDETRFEEVEKHRPLKGLFRFMRGADEQNLTNMLSRYKQIVEKDLGTPFPQEPLAQLRQAIEGVFNSWHSSRAISYRQVYGIPDDLGTAVTVQMMVFGNRDTESATGVAFTRDTTTGNAQMVGEYLPQAQGEDLVAGKRTPKPISKLEYELPDVYEELRIACRELEQHYKRVQDIEFTIESAKLWLLQTRNAPLDPEASVKIAVRMVEEDLIDKREAFSRVYPAQLEQLSKARLAEETEEGAIDYGLLIAKGLSASSGVAIGAVTFSVDEAIRRARNEENVILVCSQLKPDDIAGMLKASGIVASRGGMTSHAALIARSMGKPCVVGCETIRIDEVSKSFAAPGRIVRCGDMLTVSGDTGRVFWGILPTEEPEDFPELREFRSWRRTGPFSGAWSRAAYPGQAIPDRDYFAIARKLSSDLPWSTEKANVIEALKLLHPKMLIRQEVAEAHDVQTIQEQMYDVIRSGYWNGPRTCYYPSALGKAGWHMAIKTIEEVDEFLNNPDFEGFSGAGGYPRWIQDPNLKEIITVYDPPRLGLPQFEDEHFVFTISCRTNPDYVLIELNIGTAQLRSIDGVDSWELAHAVLELDHERYHNKGRQLLTFGGKYMQSDVVQQLAILFSQTESVDEFCERCTYLLDVPDESARRRICSAIADQVMRLGFEVIGTREIASAITEAMRTGEIPLGSYDVLVDPVPLRIARQVMDTVFNRWWEKPFELPFVMQALEEVFQLPILEIQGHFGPDGEVNYMLVYDAKGREESIAAERVNV